MKTKFMGAACAAALVLAGGLSAAQAADIEAAAYDWSGLYAGIAVGGGFGATDHRFSNGAPSDTSDLSGLLVGVYAGYNMQMDRIVLGLEGDIDYSAVDGSYENTSGMNSAGSSELNFQGSARLRLGYAVDRALIYATGGLAFGDFDYKGGPSKPICCGFSATEVGWTAGGGLEYALTDNLLARVEYRYTDFGGSTGGLRPDYPDVNMHTSTATHAVKLGLAMKF